MPQRDQQMKNACENNQSKLAAIARLQTQQLQNKPEKASHWWQSSIFIGVVDLAGWTRILHSAKQKPKWGEVAYLSFSASSWAVVKRCSSRRRLLFSASNRLASSALSSTTSAPLDGLPALMTRECKMHMCTNWHYLACHAHHTAADSS